jgi:large subunit ribosomal protein L5
MEATATVQSQATPPPRLRERYEQEVLPALIDKFGYSTPMQAPCVTKITLNMGVGEAKQDAKALEAAQEQLATIAGQHPNIRRARKSIASFKVREGMPVGMSVTLRRARMWEFLDRLCSIAVPRIRDFRGLNPRSFDGRGNYSMGVREQLIFPEIDYDSVDQVRGLDVTITTSAQSDREAFELLLRLGMPFAKEGRPGGVSPEVEAEVEEERRKEEARQKAEAEQAALEQLKEENPEAYERPEEPSPAGGDAGGTASEEASATAGGGGSPATTGPAEEEGNDG